MQQPDRSQGNYAMWNKKLNLKMYIIGFHLCNILKWQNYRDGGQTRSCWGQKWERRQGCDYREVIQGSSFVMMDF